MALLAWGAALLLGGSLVQDPKSLHLASEVADSTVRQFASKDLKPDQIGIAICSWNATGQVLSDDYRGNEAMYPASVVKLFYLDYLAHLVETGKLKKTDEIERAAHDMIVDSDNDATNWLLEVITGATSGPELSSSALKRWMNRRQAVNRYFQSKGYRGINTCQKTWDSGPYGRERQGYGPNWEHKNSLTPNACLRLLVEVMADQAATPASCAWMRGFLSRSIPADAKDANSQSAEFSGKILPSGTKLWSKAGWTDSVRHDVVAVETKDGRRFAWAIFTKGHSNEGDLIPFVASEIVKRLGI